MLEEAHSIKVAEVTTENVFEIETYAEVDTASNEYPYSNLSGNRPLPVTPVYMKIENVIYPPTDIESSIEDSSESVNYVNADETHAIENIQ